MAASTYAFLDECGGSDAAIKMLLQLAVGDDAAAAAAAASLRSSWLPFLALAAQREWEARRYRWALLALLENFRHAESTLHRDRLFALLESVVLRFARAFVRQGRGLQLPYRAGLDGRSDDRFPSWIPDWTLQWPGDLHEPYESGNTFAASGTLQERIRCLHDTDELVADGYSVDVAKALSTSSNTREEWHQYFREVDAMADFAVLRLTRESREDLKWKVPIACTPYPKVATAGGLNLRLSYTALRRLVGADQQEGSSLLEKDSASYAAVLQDTLYGWKFVVTAKVKPIRSIHLRGWRHRVGLYRENRHRYR
ncbi:hypothetical protein MFIFM68171_02964 [Madurella fahalii]|uniref:Uncharacterized protein n=1 Tax=Madurella fahalii TaxID=1157608 RepID=A0ABQ0G4T2_9PEZI